MLPKILDSHIHLWPSTATSAQDHGWMTPGFFLAKRHGPVEYDAATASSPPAGFVYVETDRYLPSSSPDVSPEDAREVQREKVQNWARAPLEELAFLRRVVTGEVQDGDGARREDSSKVKGLVIWAPFALPKEVFSVYLDLARQTLGPETWSRVVGFRFLLQGRGAEEVRGLVGNQWFVGNVQSACEAGRVFDVGVDAHRDGVETVEAASALVEGAGEGVTFVLNHLCKPDLSSSGWSGFERWKAALTRLSAHQNVYMKLSGALNEFAPSTTPSEAEDVLKALRLYLEHVVQTFGVRRVMFGSDWPVCNVGGPKGESGNWSFWREVVDKWIDEKELNEEERAGIWGGNAAKAYRISDF